MPFVSFWVSKCLGKNRDILSCFIIVTVSFSLVVSVLVFSRSMIKGMQDRIVYFSSGHLTVYSDKADIQTDNTECTGVVNGYCMLYSKDKSQSVAVKGVPSSYLESRARYLKYKSDGKTGNGFVISSRLASKLGIDLNDRFAMLIVPDSGQAVRPEVSTVSGVYDSGYSEIDDNIVFCDFDYAKKLFPDPKSVSVEIIIKNYSYAELMKTKDLLSGYHFKDWMQLNADVYQNYISSNQAIILILILAVFLSCYFTVSVTRQIVFDKKFNIGVCRLCGADTMLVRRAVFVLISGTVFVALVTGSGLGILLGCNMASLISVLGISTDALSNYLLDFDIVIPWASVFFLFVFHILISSVLLFFKLRRDFSHESKVGIMKI